MAAAIDGSGQIDSFQVQVRVDGEAEARAVPKCGLEPANPDMLQGICDLTKLTFLNEPSISGAGGCSGGGRAGGGSRRVHFIRRWSP